jgi:hypothetical protein
MSIDSRSANRIRWISRYRSISASSSASDASCPRLSSRHDRRISLSRLTTRTTPPVSPFIASTDTAFSVLNSTWGLICARSPASRASTRLARSAAACRARSRDSS